MKDWSRQPWLDPQNSEAPSMDPLPLKVSMGWMGAAPLRVIVFPRITE